jgi:WNK lysine deficient protein kinase
MRSSNSSNVVIAKSPTGRYVCYNDVVGRGAYKIVYRGYDKYEGKEVAWNMVKLGHLNDLEMNMIIDEVMLLKTLSPQNKYIINFHNAWIDDDHSQLHFITGLALSGTLKKYIERIDHINMRVIKKWCKQILEGINFLHQQHIAHRDLKCNNIFINSNTGDILIGDLGLAKKRYTQFHSTIGTPEYMAPEMYEEETAYDEKVDIYSFGMCFLEMITKKTPYSECTGLGNILKKVTSGCKPLALQTVKNAAAKEILEQCLKSNPTERPSAAQLLEMNFFNTIVDEDNDTDLVITQNTVNDNCCAPDLKTVSTMLNEVSENAQLTTQHELKTSSHAMADDLIHNSEDVVDSISSDGDLKRDTLQDKIAEIKGIYESSITLNTNTPSNNTKI